jgi:2-polyprenyl-3-methyl-5-hydroxy-6-metoxy-1,4-benzoquinol methylase
LLRDRLKSILRGPVAPRAAGPPAADLSRARPSAKSGKNEVFRTRTSRGLEQFVGGLNDLSGLSILDLGGANQENVNFITGLGHKFYSEDFLRVFQEIFAGDPADQSNPSRIEYFLGQVLDYPDEQFDGVLAWDLLEYMEPALLSAAIDRLARMLKPKGYLLAFFHAEERLDTVPCYSFRIEDVRNLQVCEYGKRTPSQLFNNRRLEKLFQKFESVKFFLTRESLREVIVRK